MKLKKYLKKNKLTQKDFAKLTDLRPMAISLFVRGLQIPKIKAMRIIVKTTKGAVLPADFY